MYNHITYNPQILGGKPHIGGTRLSVEFIMELLASGGSIKEIQDEYPQLSTEAIQEAIQYSANAVKNEILISSKITVEAYYDGTVFRPQKPVTLKPNTYVEITIETEQTNKKDKVLSLSEIAETMSFDGPPDLSTNLDQYLYGDKK